MAVPKKEFPVEDLLQLTCCQRACPVETDVSSYLALIAQGDMDTALSIVREVNPFPGICGRVCDHACEEHCRRAESDAPVAIRALKRFLVDREIQRGLPLPEPLPATRAEKIAVVGAGPAGITAASDLVRRGFRVTVFDALPAAGGMMRVGIPDYRLPNDVLDYDIEYQQRMGVEFKCDCALGRDFTLSDLKTQGYRAVLLATGAHGSHKLKVKGADLPGVLGGIDFLRQVKLGPAPAIGKRVVVIGGGDVAMDTARTALRLGAKSVDLFCLESHEQMPAHDWETKEALDEQIVFHCGWGPAEINGDEKVEQITFMACTSLLNTDGKFAPTFAEEQRLTVDADTVLVSIGQFAEFAHLPGDGIEVTPSQLYAADAQTLQTDVPWVFAAGDAVTGTATVIQAVASGHRAAASIIEYLDGKELTGHWRPLTRVDRVARVDIPSDWEERPMVEEEERPVDERIRSFAEVKTGLTEAQARAEAARCMRCDAETRSYSYSRAAREQIYFLSRRVQGDEAKSLELLKQRLVANLQRKSTPGHKATLDDLIFLPANLTRLVIDPYREPCSTKTDIGDGIARPLTMAGPLIIGGLPYDELSPQALTAITAAVQSVNIAVRLPLGMENAAEGAKVILVAPMTPTPADFGSVAAIELQPDTELMDVATLQAALNAYRAKAPGIPVGVSVTKPNIGANISAAVEAGADFATITAMPDASWRDDEGYPEIDALAEAVEALRAINREEDIDLLYFGGVRSGADLARVISLGARSAVLGHAARIALGMDSDPMMTVEEGAERLAGFVKSQFMEASILARCCGKTDVLNLEPEDLRSLTVETSQATGVPLVGRDINYRCMPVG